MFLFGLRSFFKRLLIVAVILGLMLLWSVYIVSADYIPYDSLSVSYTVPAFNGTVCDDLLPAVSHDRTLLYASIITDGANDGSIFLGSFIYLSNLRQNQVSVSYPYIFNNVAVGCTRANNKPFQFILVYVDYAVSVDQSSVVVSGNVNVNNFPSVQVVSGNVNADIGVVSLNAESFTQGDWMIGAGLIILIFISLIALLRLILARFFSTSIKKL